MHLMCSALRVANAVGMRSRLQVIHVGVDAEASTRFNSNICNDYMGHTAEE
jgi:hypothetical protein